MVKAQKSPGRKTSHCLRRQGAARADMEEEGPHHTPHPSQEQEVSKDGEASASAKMPSEGWDHMEAPVDVQDKEDPDVQLLAKPLWKPIPPLMPQPDQDGPTPGTREQSCQTESSPGWNSGFCLEPGDPPLLQQPLQTSKSGIQQIIECFRSGTNQLKHMLLKEVDTIFECKMCRSLFRGLPNLITHKEYYCLSRPPESDGSSGDAMKDLLDAIYPRAERSEYVVRLEPIQSTNKAVFQYLTTEEELARYPSRSASARASPVPWDAEAEAGGDASQASQASQLSGPESPGANQGQKAWEDEEEAKEEQTQPEDEGSNSGVEDVSITCCLCGQEFNSRRSIRRHCRKMHQTKLEELRKFTETRTVPTSLLSVVKGRPRTLSSPTGKSCPVCFKTFATKANVRRHFDEVHRGLRRDTISPGMASRPGQPFSLEATPPKKSSSSSPTRSQGTKSTPVASKATPAGQTGKAASQAQASPAASSGPSRCSLCKRNYSSQLMLKRHMRIVHKIYSMKNRKAASSAAPPSTPASATNNVRVKEEAVNASEEEEEEEEEASGSPAVSPDNNGAAKGVSHITVKVKEEEASASPKPPSSSASRPAASSGIVARMSKLSVGFDFKQLFCKLCKRQFSSRQNLSKHIELHTDGNDIFIKFYRCPLCRYESRRKRDVLRHVTVVHKKSSGYLAKIMPKLESRAVKRLAEVVLNSAYKRTGSGIKEEVNGRQGPSPSSSSSSSPSPPVTRRQETSTAGPPPSSAPPHLPVTRKQERQQLRPLSPPLTRRSEKHLHTRNCSSSSSQAPHTRRHEGQSESSATSTEVRVTKNFSLHACDQCGRAFAKKLYLESHKRSHRNATAPATSRRKGVSTRSKSMMW